MQYGFGGDSDFAKDIDSNIVGQYRHRELIHQASGIRLGDHFVQCGAGFAFAANNCPIHRRASAILGQQRAVHIERAFARVGQQCGRQHEAVVKRKQKIRLQHGYRFRQPRMVAAADERQRNIVQPRQFGNTAKPDVFMRIIGVRINMTHSHALRQQYAQAAHAYIVIGKDYRAAHTLIRLLFSETCCSSTASIR